MEILKGILLPKFPLSLTYVIDLIHYEGSLVSIYVSDSKEYYLYCWCEIDTIYNRWLIFRVTDNQLKCYIECKLSLKELVINPIDKFHYVLDINDDLEVIEVCIIFPENLPNSYIPEENSLFDSSLISNQSISNKDELMEYLFHESKDK